MTDRSQEHILVNARTQRIIPYIPPAKGREPSELRNAPSLDPASHWVDCMAKIYNVGKLWRIHGDLYDLTPYYDLHPGGRVFLERTRESDCTEPFECHDVQKISQVLLDRYSRRGLLLTEYWGWVIIKCIAICY